LAAVLLLTSALNPAAALSLAVVLLQAGGTIGCSKPSLAL
jgi:hypothetical protein